MYIYIFQSITYGIPLGPDPPFMANLPYCCNIMKRSDFFRQKNETCERIINFHFFRSIDDLCAFHNDKLENNYNDIYPND